MQLNTLNYHNNIAIVTYDSHGHRMPLTSGLIARWVGKCASATKLFMEETDHNLLIDMPPHWRSAVWALGCWWAGGQVSFNQVDLCRGGVHLSNSLEKLEDSKSEVKVAQSLDHLSHRWPGELPWDIEDGVQIANQQPDSPPLSYQGELKRLLTERQLSLLHTAQNAITSIPEHSLISITISDNDNYQTEQTALICAAAWNIFQLTPQENVLLPIALISGESPLEKRQQWEHQEASGRTLVEFDPNTCEIKD